MNSIFNIKRTSSNQKKLDKRPGCSEKKVHQLKIATKINMAFLGIIVLFAAVLILNILMINTVVHLKTRLSASYECLNLLKDMEKNISIQMSNHNSVLSFGKKGSSSGTYVVAVNGFNTAKDALNKRKNVLAHEEIARMDSLAKLHDQLSGMFFNTTLTIGKKISNGIAEDEETVAERNVAFKALEEFDIKLRDEITGLEASLQKKIDVFNESIQKQFNSILLYFVSATLIAIALTIVFSVFLSKSILSNVKLLQASAKAVGEGNLQVDVKVKASDEIGYLGRVFSDTIEKLRSLIEKISFSSHTIFAASDQVLSYNTQSQNNIESASRLMCSIAEGAEGQQKNIEKIYSNAGIISENISETSASADLLFKYITETNSVGISSLSGLKETVGQMTHINDEILCTKDLINNLQEKSKSIEGIADIIKGIASQTNLLSLNASIEAARAGDQGKGFSVVADEIRKLAIQVGESSKDILKIIRDLNDEVRLIHEKMNANTVESEKGIALVQKTGEAFNTIITSVNQQLERMTVLSSSVASLSQGFNNVNQSIQEILQSSQQITASTKDASDTLSQQFSMSQELTSSASELSKVASELQSLVSVFKV